MAIDPAIAPGGGIGGGRLPPLPPPVPQITTIRSKAFVLVAGIVLLLGILIKR